MKVNSLHEIKMQCLKWAYFQYLQVLSKTMETHGLDVLDEIFLDV